MQQSISAVQLAKKTQLAERMMIKLYKKAICFLL